MNRTIFLMIGILVSLMFMYIANSFVSNTLYDEEESVAITNVAALKIGNGFAVSWETDIETNGIVNYRNSTSSDDQKYYGFSRTHKVVIEDVGAGMIFYNITSCDITGVCASSYGHNITI